MTTPTYSGGCQCGSIRFRIKGVLNDSSICHCRMCQKAFGGYFAPLVSTKGAELTWTRGTLKHFQSSNLVKRGFCDACGTPLTYEAPDIIAIAAGAFDDPSLLPPTFQHGLEGKLSLVDHFATLPGLTTEEDESDGDYIHRIISYQHPDHDTDTWPQPHGAKP
jgi:hypothetical protein